MSFRRFWELCGTEFVIEGSLLSTKRLIAVGWGETVKILLVVDCRPLVTQQASTPAPHGQDAQRHHSVDSGNTRAPTFGVISNLGAKNEQPLGAFKIQTTAVSQEMFNMHLPLRQKTGRSVEQQPVWIHRKTAPALRIRKPNGMIGMYGSTQSRM